MKLFRNMRFAPLLAAGLFLAPLTSEAGKKDQVTVWRDRDGDGHYNKKTYEVPRHRRHGNHYYGNHYRGGSYNRGYYNRGYGYGYYGRPSYGYGYGSPYYYGYRPSVGISLSVPAYTRSTYYRTEPVTSSYSDDLAVDVQRALKRRGYYSGAIDGDIGPGSRSAIRAYQADRGLPVTGRIDSNLVRALGIG